MALPPEPLAELIPAANLIVVAVVVAVLSTGAKPPPPETAAALEPGATSVGRQSAPQRVKLRVTRALKGDARAAAEIEVEKPAGAYLLEAGNQGAFFIDAHGVIIGRYGPDTHRVEAVEHALKR